MKLRLELELIPEGSWHKSLANLLPKPVWDKVRREVYAEFRYTCSICGAEGVRVNCHESWKFDDKKHIQFLKGFMCLCDDCHSIKHWGNTVNRVHKGELPKNYLNELTEHFCRVNKCLPAVFEAHKVAMGTLYQKRSRYVYRIDFGNLGPDSIVKEWMELKKLR